MQDKQIQAIDRTLASVVSVMTAAVHRAETLTDLALADDLHASLREIKRIHSGLGRTGQKYAPPKPPVRI